MKIYPIFANKLFAFRYDREKQDEYTRLFDMWTDSEWLLKFTEENTSDLPPKMTKEKFIEQLIDDAFRLEEIIDEYANSPNKTLDMCFQPLHNDEYQLKNLSLQKNRHCYFRVYAIKIEENCFVITGGAIKLTRTMQERPHTSKELDKLKQCKEYLHSQAVCDIDSFFELVSEIN